MEQLYNDILFLMRKENKIICNQQDLPRNTRKRYLRRILIRSLSTLISIYNWQFGCLEDFLHQQIGHFLLRLVCLRLFAQEIHLHPRQAFSRVRLSQ